MNGCRSMSRYPTTNRSHFLQLFLSHRVFFFSRQLFQAFGIPFGIADHCITNDIHRPQLVAFIHAFRIVYQVGLSQTFGYFFFQIQQPGTKHLYP